MRPGDVLPVGAAGSPRSDPGERGRRIHASNAAGGASSRAPGVPSLDGSEAHEGARSRSTEAVRAAPRPGPRGAAA